MEKLDVSIRCLFFERNLKICQPYGQRGFKTMYMVNGVFFCNLQYVLVARNNMPLLDNVGRQIDVYVNYRLADWTYTSTMLLDSDGEVTRLGCWNILPLQLRGLCAFPGDDHHFLVSLQTVLRLVEVDKNPDENHFDAVTLFARCGILMSPYIFHYLFSKRKK